MVKKKEIKNDQKMLYIMVAAVAVVAIVAVIVIVAGNNINNLAGEAINLKTGLKTTGQPRLEFRTRANILGIDQGFVFNKYDNVNKNTPMMELTMGKINLYGSSTDNDKLTLSAPFGNNDAVIKTTGESLQLGSAGNILLTADLVTLDKNVEIGDRLTLTNSDANLGVGHSVDGTHGSVYIGGNQLARLQLESGRTSNWALDVEPMGFAIDNLETQDKVIVIDNYNRVGVGTESPQAKLDVNGEALFQDDVLIEKDLDVQGALRSQGAEVMTKQDVLNLLNSCKSYESANHKDPINCNKICSDNNKLTCIKEDVSIYSTVADGWMVGTGARCSNAYAGLYNAPEAGGKKLNCLCCG